MRVGQFQSPPRVSPAWEPWHIQLVELCMYVGLVASRYIPYSPLESCWMCMPSLSSLVSSGRMFMHLEVFYCILMLMSHMTTSCCSWWVLTILDSLWLPQWFDAMYVIGRSFMKYWYIGLLEYINNSMIYMLKCFSIYWSN